MDEYYQGIGSECGKIIPKSDALAYAMAQCGISLSSLSVPAPCQNEFTEMLEEWFFSGSWIKVNGNEV